jgi:hypothetical protein
LTAAPSPVQTDVRGRERQAVERLVFEEEGMQVTLQAQESNWRGTVSVEVTVPLKASYGIDLRQLDRGTVSYDAGRRLLRLKAPDPDVVAVEPDLAHLGVTAHYGGCRFSLYDDDVAQRLQLRLLREDYPAAAREHAAAQRAGLRDRGRQRLADHLRRLLEAADLDVAVEVE